jgi:hypothetical protein
MGDIMRKALVTSVALLALSATMAAAGTVNFYWTDCGGNGGTSNRNFACTASTAIAPAAGSFTLSAPMADFDAIEVTVDLQVEDTVIPPWWDFTPSPGACHGTSLSMTFDFSVFANGSGACTDPFGQPATGALASYVETGNRARAIGVAAIDASAPVPLIAATEYYGVRLALKQDKATGVGSCAGCTLPVALVLNNIRALGNSQTSIEDCEAVQTSQCITWQGAGAATCLATPTHNRTWGQVKSLYR